MRSEKETCIDVKNSTILFCGVASSISEGDIFIYSRSAQLISFEIKSISKEVNCAEHKYIYEYVPLTYRAGDAPDTF